MTIPFPTTRLAWIDDQLATIELGGEAAGRARAGLLSHVIERYRDPLVAYLRAAGVARGADADDVVDEIVHEFLARRVAREDYFARFRASGLRLRRYLMNGALLLARERRRDRRFSRGPTFGRESGLPAGVDLDRADPRALDAEAAFDRAWTSQLLARAAERVAGELFAEGDARAWTVFRRHFVDGLGYAEIGRETGASEREIRNELRRAGRRLESALRAELLDEGIPEAEIEDELRRVLGDS